MRRAPLAALALAIASCARGTGSEPVVVVEIPPAVPASAEEEPAPPRRAPQGPGFVGHWEGVGVQKNGSTWKMIVDIESLGPGRCGRVRYPTVPCAAEWICEERSKDGTLRAREHLTEGVRNCIDNGEMTMTLAPDGGMDWRWVDPDADSGETAQAHLVRSEGRR